MGFLFFWIYWSRGMCHVYYQELLIRKKKISIWKVVRRKPAVTFWLKEWREKQSNHTPSDIVSILLHNLEKKVPLYFSILWRDSRPSKWDKILEKEPSRFYDMKTSTTRKMKKRESWRDKNQQELNNYSKPFFLLKILIYSPLLIRKN